ncbi:hypothetical protein ABT063_50800, partial [Streptomyces sp. NPDC002838]|uniref:hypothetical protein n=1 Tax=Streptomyces sp. NPDC002838 TaxID=3154436 RepID=UPI00331F3126
MWRSHLALRTVRRACVPGVATLRRSIRRALGGVDLEHARDAGKPGGVRARVGLSIEDDLDGVRRLGGELPVHDLGRGGRGRALGQGALVGEAEAQTEQG